MIDDLVLLTGFLVIHTFGYLTSSRWMMVPAILGILVLSIGFISRALTLMIDELNKLMNTSISLEDLKDWANEWGALFGVVAAIATVVSLFFLVVAHNNKRNKTLGPQDMRRERLEIEEKEYRLLED